MTQPDLHLIEEIRSFLDTYTAQVQHIQHIADQLDSALNDNGPTEDDWLKACKESDDYVVDLAPGLLERVLATVVPFTGLDDVEIRPSTRCRCGHPLVWVNGAWEHDCAPSVWGNDHEPHAEEPDTPARHHWDTVDGITD